MDSEHNQPNQEQSRIREITVKVGGEVKRYAPLVVGAAAGAALMHAAPHIYDAQIFHFDPTGLRYAIAHLVDTQPVLANIIGIGLGAATGAKVNSKLS